MTMLIFHIAIALISVAFSTFLYFAPTRTRLRISWTLVGLTVATGTYMIIFAHASMLQTCMTGLLYVGCMTALILAARNKLLVFERQNSK